MGIGMGMGMGKGTATGRAAIEGVVAALVGLAQPGCAPEPEDEACRNIGRVLPDESKARRGRRDCRRRLHGLRERYDADAKTWSRYLECVGGAQNPEAVIACELRLRREAR